MKKDCDIIIIGAGAAGLIAMRDLLEAGYKVCMIEASAKPGGRIATIPDNGFNTWTEAGAEFIHGKLPLTMKLLDEANISYHEVKGNMITVQHGKWQEELENDDQWSAFMQKLKELKTDMSIAQFLEKQFPSPAYDNLHKKVKDLAEGFDLADINKASILAVQNEWSNINETQYRITGGYIKLIEFLIGISKHPNGETHYNTCVNKIDYSSDQINIHTSEGKLYQAKKIIVTVSLGVLKSGSIEFVPSLQEHELAFQQIGFGAVIKILLQFKTNFWLHQKKDIGFILSDEEIPTWWTQSNPKSKLLTGWLGGPRALARAYESNEKILQSAIRSLSSIFNCPLNFLEEQLDHYEIFNWNNQPHIKGGYSYNTIDSPNAKRILSQPVNGKIYFAGEAFFEGEWQGTVEAALESGHMTAKLLKSQYEPANNCRNST